MVESAGWVGHAAAGAQASYKSRDGEMRERQPRQKREGLRSVCGSYNRRAYCISLSTRNSSKLFSLNTSIKL